MWCVVAVYCLGKGVFDNLVCLKSDRYKKPLFQSNKGKVVFSLYMEFYQIFSRKGRKGNSRKGRKENGKVVFMDIFY
jgi:hypothetical protein